MIIARDSSQVRYSDLNSELDESFSVESRLWIQMSRVLEFTRRKLEFNSA